MAFVITQNCCKDASCVPVCPVDCIRPLDDCTDMLFIDPDTCIDCGACMDECPVNAIHYEDDLPPEQLGFQQINAEYFRHHPLEPATVAAPTKHAPVLSGLPPDWELLSGRQPVAKGGEVAACCCVVRLPKARRRRSSGW